jgi:hypothetical protein
VARLSQGLPSDERLSAVNNDFFPNVGVSPHRKRILKDTNDFKSLTKEQVRESTKG